MVTNRNLKAIEEALQHQNNKQQTPIHVACLYLNIKAIKILITKQCEKVIATVCSYRKRKALADSLRNASTATLLWIIRRGSIVQEMCSIICACRRHNTSNVCEMESRMLGRHRIIDGDIVERGCKVCNTAISSIIILLIEKCREIQFICNEVGHTTLITAAMHDSVGVMRALLSASAAKDLIKATDSNFHTALHHAAARGISRQVLMLLAEGALPNAQDNRGATPLHYAAIRGYSQCIDLLYKANQLNDIKTKNRHTAFMWAALNGINKSLSTMLSVNPFINRRDEDATSSTALHLAAGNNQFETVRMLVRYGWQIEDVNVFGESTLHCACRGGNADTVKFLLSCGADIFRKRNDGCTALHLSAASEHAEALSELLQWYRDSSLINAKNGFGDTALHVAIKNLSVQCAYRLTKAGARVQTKDGRGWDSLMLAIGSRCWSILVMILRESPNFNCFSHLDEVSTLSIAMQSRNSALITFLKLYGALLPNDLRSTAAIKIQRWFRSKLDDQLQIQSKISKYHSERLLCEREQIILFEQTIHSI